MLTWESVPKNQTDPETIEEAIDRLITAHDNASTSHLGEGKSLETHKANEILDHPQGSVVSDKKSVGQLELSTVFDSVDGWTINASASYHQFGSLGLITNTVVDNVAEIYLDDGVFIEVDDFYKNTLFQTALYISHTTGGLYEFGLALNASVLEWLGIGFKINGSTVSALFNDGFNLNEEEIFTVEAYKVYVFRAFVNKELNKVQFLINGTLLHSFDFVLNYSGDEWVTPVFRVTKKSGTGSRSMNVSNLLVSRDY